MSMLSSLFGAENQFKATGPVNKFHATDPTTGATLGQANTQAAGGAGPASGTIGRQNMLSDALTQAAMGTGGPSVAENQLRQATSANVNRAAGTVASTRGINPALAARMSLDAGAGANQEAAGQAATLRAGEQIAARGQLGQNLSQTGQMQLGQQGAGTHLLGTAGGLNMQSQGLNQSTAGQNAQLEQGAQQINAGVASQNAATNASMVGGLMSGAGAAMGMSDERAKADVHRLHSEALPGVPEATFRYKDEPQGMLHRGVIAQDVEKHFPWMVGRTSEGMRTVPAELMKFPFGGAVPAAPTADPLHGYLDELHGAGSMEAANAGSVEPAPTRPSSIPSPTNISGETTAAPAAAPKKGGASSFLSGMGSTMTGQAGANAFQSATARPVMGAGSIYAHGGSVQALVSPGEIVVPPGAGPREAAARAAQGDKVPGKARVGGDSPRNDTVHASLTPGSVVVPRSHANDPKKAASFVASVLRRQGGQKYAGGGKVPKTPAPAPKKSETMNFGDDEGETIQGGSAQEQIPPYNPLRPGTNQADKVHARYDLSKGGLVPGRQAAAKTEDLPVKAEGKRSTARGAGRAETKRRMSTSKKPKYKEA